MISAFVKNTLRSAVPLACLLAAALVAAPLHAAEMLLQLDPAQTHVEFTLEAVLHTVHGSFQLKRGVIRFDPVTGKAGGEVVIDAASGDSGNKSRDQRMHRNVLESSRYPQIVFTPDRVDGKLDADRPSQIQVHGTFTIHGAGHEMILPIQVQMGKEQLTASTHFVVPYVQWGMKNPSNFILRVKESVNISIRAVGHLAAAAAD